MLQFAIKPMWGINYLTNERFKLPQLDEHVDLSGGALSIGRYFTEMLDPSMNWTDVADMVRHWNGQFCLKGVMSVADAKHAVEIGWRSAWRAIEIFSRVASATGGSPAAKKIVQPINAHAGAQHVDRPRAYAALVGGRNFGESQFDRATTARRQPGSPVDLPR